MSDITSHSSGLSMPEGYINKTAAIDQIRKRTGYGRLVVERKVDELERNGIIRIYPDPGRKGILLLSLDDIEKIVQTLTTVA